MYFGGVRDKRIAKEKLNHLTGMLRFLDIQLESAACVCVFSCNVKLEQDERPKHMEIFNLLILMATAVRFSEHD